MKHESVRQLPLKLSEVSGLPFYRQIVDQMAELIRSGQLAPSTRLPSVRELAGHLLVSLITVRRAYADLEAARLIVRRQGQGTFVAEEVETPSRKQALAEGRQTLADAVNRAERLGLPAATIRQIVDEELS